jgi:hypothetical protein
VILRATISLSPRERAGVRVILKVACSPFFGPPDKGDCLIDLHVSLRTSHCSVMSSPLVAGCAELFGRRVIE